MINLVYVVAMGGMTSAVSSRRQFERNKTIPPSTEIPDPGSGALEAMPLEPVSASMGSSSERLADRYEDLARSLAGQGRRQEARSIWFQALDLRIRLTSIHPENPRFLSSWCDCCNDLACFLLDQPAGDEQDLSQAVSLASKATETFPNQSIYWNTLGAAYYRAGDNHSAIDALHQSLQIQCDQGTGFDYFYLAMACSRLEQHGIARLWYEQGMAWIEEHDLDQNRLRHLGAEAKEHLGHFEQSEANI
jgi:tetratricopeptide (TPR) repeat protein